jgi:type II secretory pathway pseudopilin PulG
MKIEKFLYLNDSHQKITHRKIGFSFVEIIIVISILVLLAMV